MIKVNTVLVIVDNSRVGVGTCIKILDNKRYAKVGDIIIVAISAYGEKSKVSRAMVVATKYPIIRKNGIKITYPYNGIIILDENNNPVGSKINNTLPMEILNTKIRSLARIII